MSNDLGESSTADPEVNECCYENKTAKEWFEVAAGFEWELDIYKPLYLSLIVTLLSVGLWLTILNIPSKRRKKIKELFEVRRQNSIMLENMRSQSQKKGEDNEAFSGTDGDECDVGRLRDVESETNSVCSDREVHLNTDLSIHVPEIVIEPSSDFEDNRSSVYSPPIFRISSESDLSSVVSSENEEKKKRRAQPDEKDFKKIKIYD